MTHLHPQVVSAARPQDYPSLFLSCSIFYTFFTVMIHIFVHRAEKT